MINTNHYPQWSGVSLNDFLELTAYQKIILKPKENHLEIVIKPDKNNKQTRYIKLGYDKIVQVDALTKNNVEIEEKDKNIVLGSAIGTMVLGPLGAPLGAILAHRTKEKRKVYPIYFFRIMFLKDNNVEQMIFSSTLASADKIETLLKQKSGIKSLWQDNTLTI